MVTFIACSLKIRPLCALGINLRYFSLRFSNRLKSVCCDSEWTALCFVRNENIGALLTIKGQPKSLSGCFSVVDMLSTVIDMFRPLLLMLRSYGNERSISISSSLFSWHPHSEKAYQFLEVNRTLTHVVNNLSA